MDASKRAYVYGAIRKPIDRRADANPVSLARNRRLSTKPGRTNDRERARLSLLVDVVAHRARLWPTVFKAYGGYRGYQERTSREIPLVILEPRP